MLIDPTSEVPTKLLEDPVNKQLLNILQSKFPITQKPFYDIAKALEITEDDVISRVTLLKEQKVVRQISAIFDTRSLGYESSLVAAKVPSEKVDEVAAIINKHPGVSHNYLRSHDYNLWFTLAVSPESRFGLEKTLEILKEKAKIETLRILPSNKLYKIGVMLDLVASDGVVESKLNIDKTEPDNICGKEDIPFVMALQEDLPIVSQPFDVIAKKHNLNINKILEKAKNFIDLGIMRRFAAVLHHRKAGFSANLMGVWIVPLEKADEVGKQFASYKAVSHCYLRPSFEDWPFNMYTMLHGISESSLRDKMVEMARETGIEKYDALTSVKEYKKVRVKYFSKNLKIWETENS